MAPWHSAKRHQHNYTQHKNKKMTLSKMHSAEWHSAKFTQQNALCVMILIKMTVSIRTVRKVALSWIVIYPNIWNKTSGSTVGNLICKRSQNIFANWSKMPSINYKQMCFYPTLFVDVDRRYLRCRPTLAHTCSLSFSLCIRLLSFRFI
jgi:hypothetical protein